ncbi:universal stress protein [Actinokineospora sp. NBRC 105648]|uniref:universal stress protein n=1 Tax=Actinokineospora sp. NBRC 105648 TaxID=3032206 RepID=UPI0024A2B4FF|nr:universal stress protein [Actinokineospora sp. NBRC 105648]GLZ40783.1 universal stress protein [Actinokineospora sp. NBRC 105648]
MTSTMERPTAVTVGYNGSAFAHRAAHWSAHYARLGVGGVRLVQAYEYNMLDALVSERIVRCARDELAREAGKLRHDFPDLAIDTVLKYGHPGDVLAEATADMSVLVVGAGGGGLTHGVFGSEVGRLVRRVPHTVVVVRGAEKRADQSPVVLGVHDPADDSAAIQFGFDFAARAGVALNVVHTHPRGVADSTDLAALDQWRTRYPNVRVTVESVVGDAARTLVERSTHARLLVIGYHGHSTLHHTLRRSVSRAATQHAACPVAITTTPG